MATFKDLMRMCNNTECKHCPLSEHGKFDSYDCFTSSIAQGDIEHTDKLIDEWVALHPEIV